MAFDKAQLVCRSMIDFGYYFQLLQFTENSSTVEGMDEFLEEVSKRLSINSVIVL